jgi:hypothetical protein|eukprot:COSAG01_NODE_2671_length_7269_cov_10.825662_1_plen_121_part_00
MNEKCAEIPSQKLEKHVWRPQQQQIFGVRRSGGPPRHRVFVPRPPRGQTSSSCCARTLPALYRRRCVRTPAPLPPCCTPTLSAGCCAGLTGEVWGVLLLLTLPLLQEGGEACVVMILVVY